MQRDGGQTVFARKTGAVGQHATGLDHQTLDQQEDRSPTGIGAVADQDLALLHFADAFETGHHACAAGYPALGRAAAEQAAIAELLWQHIGTAQVHGYHLLAGQEAFESAPARGDFCVDQTRRFAVALEQLEQFLLGEEIMVARCGQLPAFTQTPAEFGEGVFLGQRKAVVDPALVVAQQ